MKNIASSESAESQTSRLEASCCASNCPERWIEYPGVFVSSRADADQRVLDVGDDVAERTALHVVLDDDAPGDVLAIDVVGRPCDGDVGHLREPDRVPVAAGDRKAADRLEIGPVLGSKPQDDRVGDLPDGHPRHLGALERQLDRARDALDRDAAAGEILAPRGHVDLAHQLLLLDEQVGDAGDVRHRRLDPRRDGPEPVEIGAEDLDRHLRVDAREQVRQQVGQRLLDVRRDAGELLRDALADVGDRRLAGALRRGVERDDHLGDVDALGVLVALGAAGLAPERGDALDVLDHALEAHAEGVGRREARARRQDQVDLRRALVEGRQELASRASRARGPT